VARHRREVLELAELDCATLLAMPFVDPAQLAPQEVRPGWTARFFHSEHMTFAYYEIAAGAAVHRHSHATEEVWHVLDGQLEVALGDATRLLRAGEAAIVPAGMEHALSAPGPCRAIVVDHPVRERVGGVATRPRRPSRGST
jgi:quercetin dioxygenase-like cupin family protein